MKVSEAEINVPEIYSLVIASLVRGESDICLMTLIGVFTPGEKKMFLVS